MDSPALSLTEWVVLALLAEGPAHGFALARLTAASGPIGTIWQVPRPRVYRALDRLTDLGLAEPAGTEPGHAGPQRRMLSVTAAGRRAAADWLVRPVDHIRDVRTEFLIKLALIDRTGGDPQPLVDAQADRIRPIVAALRQRCDTAHGLERAVASWRYETAVAALRLMESVSR
ncbi:PadR family transcriptional regulator [Acrocarpospora sp. B8E8]|uniref:PadR family transcriptional regulator n=1 Tax=Acrocarpospora sp. B8E8 TaxID=3153572 RepID=UPI00325DAA5F